VSESQLSAEDTAMAPHIVTSAHLLSRRCRGEPNGLGQDKTTQNVYPRFCWKFSARQADELLGLPTMTEVRGFWARMPKSCTIERVSKSQRERLFVGSQPACMICIQLCRTTTSRRAVLQLVFLKVVPTNLLQTYCFSIYPHFKACEAALSEMLLRFCNFALIA
jgi:hypothetical protein